jgi:hypothetical protein
VRPTKKARKSSDVYDFSRTFVPMYLRFVENDHAGPREADEEGQVEADLSVPGISASSPCD